MRPEEGWLMHALDLSLRGFGAQRKLRLAFVEKKCIVFRNSPLRGGDLYCVIRWHRGLGCYLHMAPFLLLLTSGSITPSGYPNPCPLDGRP